MLLLQIYCLELPSPNSAFVNQAPSGFIQKIIGVSDCPGERAFHYSIAKTMVMLLLGDIDDAKKLHTAALMISYQQQQDAARQVITTHHQFCAGAWKCKAHLTGDKLLLNAP